MDHANRFATSQPQSSSSVGRRVGESVVEGEAVTSGNGTHESRTQDSTGSVNTGEQLLSGESSTALEGFNQVLVSELDTILDKFRSNSISLTSAYAYIGKILDFDPDNEDARKEQAYSFYISTLNSINSEADRTNSRSATFRSGHLSLGNPSPLANIANSPSHISDGNKELEDFLSHVSRHGSNSKPSESDSSSEEDSFGEASESSHAKSNKRRRLYETDMPFYKREKAHRDQSSNPSCDRTRKCLEIYARDIKQSKRWIKNSLSGPAEFPTVEWDNVLRGEAVNLDNVFTSLHFVSPVKESTGRIGRTEISLGVTTAARKVQTYGEWISAWNATAEATAFAFPHRKKELTEYGKYISGEFSAKVIQSHHKLILFDAAVRAKVGGGQCILLSQRDKFSGMYSALVMPDGIASFSEERRLSSRSKATKTEICNKFNANSCQFSATDCRYKHICKGCKRSGHGECDCKIKEGSSTRSAA